jgi:hypothetical protein
MLDYGAMYSQLHKSDKVFRGHSIKSAVPFIVDLVQEHKPRNLLDYGCGKGWQYSKDRVHDQWGGLMPHCYDVGWPAFSKKPKGSFDGVICTDVMEHIDKPDVDAVLSDIFSYLQPRDDGGTSFAMFWISCRPAKRKTLPDGRNVHLTVKPDWWWNKRLLKFAVRSNLIIKAHYETDDDE